MIVALIACTAILGVITVVQTYKIQDLTNLSNNVMNQMIPFDLSLIDHFNCQELNDWNQQIISGQTSDISIILGKEIKKKINDYGC